MYDVIIYGGTFAGVVAAILYKNMGFNVFLLNRYGFLGGSITESLNLYQKIFLNKESIKRDFTQFNYCNDITYKLICELLNEINSVFWRENLECILNPESVKYFLQRQLVKNEINSLFHIIPIELRLEKDIYELKVFAKEGELIFYTKRIIDASRESALIKLITNLDFRIEDVRLNMIVRNSYLEEENFSPTPIFKKHINHNRIYFSFPVETKNLSEVEIKSHILLDRLDNLFRRKKGRIQLLPAQSFINYELRDKNIAFKNIFSPFSMTKKYQPEEELIMAEEFERFIKNESLIR